LPLTANGVISWTVPGKKPSPHISFRLDGGHDAYEYDYWKTINQIPGWINFGYLIQHSQRAAGKASGERWPQA
jgi:hypothetical protein